MEGEAVSRGASPHNDSNQILSDDHFSCLNYRQKEIVTGKIARFASYLREKGKNPEMNEGYADKSVDERISRLVRVLKWLWTQDKQSTELTPELADEVVEGLRTDEFARQDGEPFTSGSKRKINDVLRSWFDYQGVDWTPDTTFNDDTFGDQPDPFTKRELRLLWEASLTYKDIPSYNNLTPEERDRWRAYIAQELGKPKEEVRPDDWKRINHRWDIPSLIRTTRTSGWRPSMVGRLKVNWYDSDNQTIYIPKGEAPKNDAAWAQKLSNEGAHALENHLEQRKNMARYDGRDEIWLNRSGNPYDSGTLNNLLRKLMDDAGISYNNRKLVWYSFRHSIGTYLFDEYKSLKIVAERLRQKSRSSAERYVHPTPEIKQDAAELM